MTSLILMIVAGLVGLALGGELLVRGAVALAHRLGLSGVVTGVVIMGSATSMPELVASAEAAVLGSPDIAWGNIIGSNIANSLLILGAAAVVAPIALHGVGKRDAVVGLFAVILLWVMTATQLASSWLGIGILVLLVIYVVWRVRHPPEGVGEEEEGEDPSLAIALLLFLSGLAVLVGGGQLLVTGAIELATIAGISEAVIGLTVVAVGTSLPELAATLAAAMRGRPDLAMGNVVGSNIYNLLLIGGVTMTIAPTPITPQMLDLEWPVLAVCALLLLIMCRHVHRIGRRFGALLLAAFAANTVLLFA